jgi:transcriptional regulator with XRE-family HTH domain
VFADSTLRTIIRAMGKRKRASDLLARNVRRLRRARGWTQYDLAAEANIRQALVSAIELGDANPTLTSIEKIAAALDVKTSELFSC